MHPIISDEIARQAQVCEHDELIRWRCTSHSAWPRARCRETLRGRPPDVGRDGWLLVFIEEIYRRAKEFNRQSMTAMKRIDLKKESLNTKYNEATVRIRDGHLPWRSRRSSGKLSSGAGAKQPPYCIGLRDPASHVRRSPPRPFTTMRREQPREKILSCRPTAHPLVLAVIAR
jgi:hypothetical protein